MAKVIVKYWRGTIQFQGTANTYAGAMRLASKNQNSWPASFWDAITGEELFDDGQGLADIDRDFESRSESGVVTLHRTYTV